LIAIDGGVGRLPFSYIFPLCTINHADPSAVPVPIPMRIKACSGIVLVRSPVTIQINKKAANIRKNQKEA